MVKVFGILAFFSFSFTVAISQNKKDSLIVKTKLSANIPKQKKITDTLDSQFPFFVGTNSFYKSSPYLDSCLRRYIHSDH